MSLVRPYGSWPSPIDAGWIARAGVSLDGVAADGESVYWLEGRPTEGGRCVVVRDGADVTPPGFNVRTRVHEYGGGAFLADRGALFFVEYADQRLYRQDGAGPPRPISPDPPRPGALRYADLRCTPDGAWLVCVRERHTDEGQPTNELVRLPAGGGGPPQVLHGGHDFYAAPRISPDGRRLAFLVWDHPRMPWDGCELWEAPLAPEGLGPAQRVAGGPEESVFQPEWGPDGALYYVSDRSGWWNLYRRETPHDRALAPLEAEFGLPHWVFDQSRYACLPDGTIACAYSRGGTERLALLDPAGGALREIATPFSSIYPARLAADARGRLCFIGGSPTLAQRVVRLDPQSGAVETLRVCLERELDPAWISRGQPIEFPGAGGLPAHAFYYAPVHPECVGPPDERPPLLVTSHGGPTSQAHSYLKLAIQYWTSRGIAVVDVDYGGSSGHGRAYRERLKGQWGVVDTADCIGAARQLAQGELVDGRRMAIRGGSAGGYTTLCALVWSDVFAAGASHYGVADVEALARDTHKFESRYLDQLIGPYPEQRELYRERSPIHHCDRLSCPVILFQGDEDLVVPPAQAEQMVRALERKGLPHAYLLFAGEQHGFRQASTIRRTLEAELYFYGRIFGFEPADALEPIEIKNL